MAGPSRHVFVKVVAGFASGAVAGWVVHDRCRTDKPCPFTFWKRAQDTGTLHRDFKPIIHWDNNWDRRDPKSLVKPPKKSDKNNGEGDEVPTEEQIKKATPTASRHLLLIRHGQYDVDASSDLTRKLTLLGQEQAELTGSRLSQLGHTYTVIVHSSMTRAQETANIIHKHLPDVTMQQSDLLREGAPCPPEPPLASWRPEYKQFYEDNARIEAAFRRYFHRADPKQKQDSYEIVVCHANVIRYFVCRALQLPPEAWLRMSLNHGSITWLTIRPTGRVGLRTLGDAGYMPPNKVTVV